MDEQKKKSAFPSFSEGLSLRVCRRAVITGLEVFSLPFRRDFH